MIKFSLTKDEIIDIIAMGGAMIGSTIIALNIGLNQYGYMMFMVSGLASIYHLNHSNVRKSMKFNTWFYLVVDILGIIRYYGG